MPFSAQVGYQVSPYRKPLFTPRKRIALNAPERSNGQSLGISLGQVKGSNLTISGFKSAIYTLTLFGTAVPCYAAVAALVVNLALAVGLSVVLNLVAKEPRRDDTVVEDYA